MPIVHYEIESAAVDSISAAVVIEESVADDDDGYCCS